VCSVLRVFKWPHRNLCFVAVRNHTVPIRKRRRIRVKHSHVWNTACVLFCNQFVADEWCLLLADSHFIEERRKSLRRWLTLVARHPAVSGDPLLSFFLTYSGADVQHKIREIFRRVPDEFTTSELAARAKVHIVAYVI
jgi:hypothetical protein